MEKIVIYRDDGVFESFIPIWQDWLEPEYDVICVQAQDLDLLSQIRPLAFIMPGGEDLKYCDKLNGAGNRKIRTYVEQGGVYMGICGGAYYGASSIEFTDCWGGQIVGHRELSFFQGVAQGSLPHYGENQYYDPDPHTATSIQMKWSHNSNSFQTRGQNCYYHGGCRFIDAQQHQQIEILASYPDDSSATIVGNCGHGKFLLSGVHLEVNYDRYKSFLYPQLDHTNPKLHIRDLGMKNLVDCQFSNLIAYLQK